ncbi:hypothetical protein C2E23DRAFT_199356 [Lenzites betulinus]|nr:hypothetical protein C2E23DRAFT_199356 [Lenzites betulinus]
MASDEGGSGGGSSTFLTSGSSALILAFLAIGLFVGGLLVMFAMRRYVVASRRRAGMWEPAGTGPWAWDDGRTFAMEPLFLGVAERRRREQEFGAKPELFDVLAKPASDDWQHIMPIHVSKDEHESTSPVPEASVLQPQPSPDELPNDPLPHVPSGFLRPFAIGVHDFVSQIRPSGRHALSPPSPPSLPPVAQPTAQAPTILDPVHLRVVLAIAMPTLRHSEGGVPQYALGITSVRLEGAVEVTGQEVGAV